MESREELSDISKKFIRIILKLRCYYKFEIYYKEKWRKHMDNGRLAEKIRKVIIEKNEFLHILLPDEDTMINVGGGRAVLVEG